MVEKGVISLVVAALSGTGVVATWVDLNTDVAVNANAIESVEKVHSVEMGYIKNELQEIKQLIKDG
tara:strand:- start:1432 stop:1629 length:198 start_codon:yes stop_codon:yes gene_type:complete